MEITYKNQPKLSEPIILKFFGFEENIYFFFDIIEYFNSLKESRKRFWFKMFLINHFKTNYLDYFNKYIQKLENCGFCNKNFAVYNFDVKIENNTIMPFNLKLRNNMYTCDKKECSCIRRKINPNSFEYISKSRKISLEDAKQYLHNISKNRYNPFYKQSYETYEEYAKRQSRGLEWFIKKYRWRRKKTFWRKK